MAKRIRNRERTSVMIDRRLLSRLDSCVQDGKAANRSDALNKLLWAGVLNGPNLAEKREISNKIDELSDYCKAQLEAYL